VSGRQARARRLAQEHLDLHLCYRNNDGDICPPNAKQARAHAVRPKHLLRRRRRRRQKLWLLISILTFAALTPGVQCAVFRRRYKELHQSLIPMVLAMLPRKGTFTFDKQLGKLEFPHNGSSSGSCTARATRRHPLPVRELAEARDRRGEPHDAVHRRLPDDARARRCAACRCCSAATPAARATAG
jgi:hypothetical protein